MLGQCTQCTVPEGALSSMCTECTVLSDLCAFLSLRQCIVHCVWCGRTPRRLLPGIGVPCPLLPAAHLHHARVLQRSRTRRRRKADGARLHVQHDRRIGEAGVDRRVGVEAGALSPRAVTRFMDGVAAARGVTVCTLCGRWRSAKTVSRLHRML